MTTFTVYVIVGSQHAVTVEATDKDDARHKVEEMEVYEMGSPLGTTSVSITEIEEGTGQ